MAEKNFEKSHKTDPLMESVLTEKNASPDSIRILLIAPYPNLIHVFRDALYDRSNMVMNALEAKSSQIPDVIHDIAFDDYDVIISRGRTAQVLQQELPNRRIFDVGVSLYDVFRILKRVENQPEKICIIGFRNIIHYAVILREYLENAPDIFTVEDPMNLPERLRRLHADGYTLILGDLMTCNYAQLLGIRSILIETGESTVNRLLDSVEDFYMSRKDLQTSNRFLHDLIHSAPHPLAVCDRAGTIIYRTDAMTPEMEALLAEMAVHVTTNGRVDRKTMVNGHPYHISGYPLISDEFPEHSFFLIRQIRSEHVLLDENIKKTPEISLEGSLHDITRRVILNVLKEERGNQAATARRLDISRTTLRKYVEEYENNA